MERFERYSRDLNIRVVGVVEEVGEDCLLIVRNYLTLLGFEDDLERHNCKIQSMLALTWRKELLVLS